MKTITKFIAMRLFALLLFPYSASAAAACHTQLDYSAGNAPDGAYESVAYQIDLEEKLNTCANNPGMALEAPTNGVNLFNADNFRVYSI